jgi:hypothetical protein
MTGHDTYPPLRRSETIQTHVRFLVTDQSTGKIL